MKNNLNVNNSEYKEDIYDVQLISSYVLVTSRNHKLPLNIERTQKLLYYIQAKYMLKREIPLFFEDFIAGEDGPYIETLEDWLNFNELDILEPSYTHSLNNCIQATDREFIDTVVKTFQDLSTEELSGKIKEEKPWAVYYNRKKNNTIPKDVIFNFFDESFINRSRLYGVYADLDETPIVNQLNLNPQTDHLFGHYPKDEFEMFVKDSLMYSGITEMSFHSLNDVLSYVSDFLIYREINVTFNELQIILFYIQKLFLKLLDKVCFEEFIYKTKDSISIGSLEKIYNFDETNLDLDLALLMEREFDYSNIENNDDSKKVRTYILEKKANKYAKESFTDKELEVMDIVLSELTKYSNFQLSSLIQSEKSWINNSIGETITTSLIYNS